MPRPDPSPADLQALIRRVRPVFREQTKALGLQAQ